VPEAGNSASKFNTGAGPLGLDSAVTMSRLSKAPRNNGESEAKKKSNSRKSAKTKGVAPRRRQTAPVTLTTISSGRSSESDAICQEVRSWIREIIVPAMLDRFLQKGCIHEI
jgi:hypothetical protein